MFTIKSAFEICQKVESLDLRTALKNRNFYFFYIISLKHLLNSIFKLNSQFIGTYKVVIVLKCKKMVSSHPLKSYYIPSLQIEDAGFLRKKHQICSLESIFGRDRKKRELVRQPIIYNHFLENVFTIQPNS